MTNAWGSEKWLLDGLSLTRQGQEGLSEKMTNRMWGSREFLLQVKGHAAPTSWSKRLRSVLSLEHQPLFFSLYVPACE